MDDLVIKLLIFAAIAIFSLVKHLAKGKQGSAPPPRPPRPRRTRPEPAAEPEPERIDLSFLQDALGLGIDMPPEEDTGLAELDVEVDVSEDYDVRDEPPSRGAVLAELQTAAALQPAVSPPRADSGIVSAGAVASFFADLDDIWDHETKTARSGKAELLRDAVILGAILAPHRHR